MDKQFNVSATRAMGKGFDVYSKNNGNSLKAFKLGRYTIPFVFVSISLASVRRINCRGARILKRWSVRR